MIPAADLLREVDIANQMERSQYPRIYLGMSSAGEACVRKIFLQWRFARIPHFSSRMLRLFDRGHREEERFVQYLRSAGHRVFEKDPETGNQFEYIEHHGHVRGHSDGIAIIGQHRVLLEMKTHNNKSFVPVKRINDLAISKFEHYCQMQKYMSKEKMEWGLYMAVNKDTDALHFEWIKADPANVAWIDERFLDVLTTKTLPEKLSEDENFWKCVNCTFNGMCFNDAPSSNSCRMCKHARMIKDGKWKCKKEKLPTPLRLNDQLTGCPSHQSISSL